MKRRVTTEFAKYFCHEAKPSPHCSLWSGGVFELSFTSSIGSFAFALSVFFTLNVIDFSMSITSFCEVFLAISCNRYGSYL